MPMQRILSGGVTTDLRGLDLELSGVLTPADHHTHRRLDFEVPSGCVELRLAVRYAPKYVDPAAARRLVERAIAEQGRRLATSEALGCAPAKGFAAPSGQLRLVDAWARTSPRPRRVPNLVTVSLDDATGAYRGAAHRQAAHQVLFLRPEAASPGLIPGGLPAGTWRLTLSVHTLVSAACAYTIQIGALTASSRPVGGSTASA